MSKKLMALEETKERLESTKVKPRMVLLTDLVDTSSLVNLDMIRKEIKSTSTICTLECLKEVYLMVKEPCALMENA